MNNNIEKKPLPCGWGAAEILRAMRQDERRFRRPQKGFTKDDAMPVKKEERTQGQEGEGP